ncbi:5'-methylthioadenosine/S-adenosylhomocysteine nucleosidase [Paramyrothecium foliicola]|nr:5'-methylthioadenosine/S-adenosylhomocysteine nucleosidase [Paramyrothecium foliicola]
MASSMRDKYDIAIVCALQAEYNAVEILLDKLGVEDDLSRSQGDANMYATGKMGNHHVVITCLPKMGKVSAAKAVANLRSTFPHISLLFITGICGGVPEQLLHAEMLLGDVIVGKSIVQYDFGKRLASGFIIKDDPEHVLSRPPASIRSLIRVLEGPAESYKLEKRATALLKDIQGQGGGETPRKEYEYLGVEEDRLFEASYLHKHRGQQSVCGICSRGEEHICDDAHNLSCAILNCEDARLQFRRRIEEKRDSESATQAHNFKIFFGAIASGDSVMRSGKERDALTTQLIEKHQEPILAFEMEGAGAWDDTPCLVVKGVCDYADSHKNSHWHNFAAATAAAVTRSIIERYPKTDAAQTTAPEAKAQPQLVGGAMSNFYAPNYGKVTSLSLNGGTNNFSF